MPRHVSQFKSAIRRLAIAVLVPAAISPIASGCVAMNIPSERLHDPGDDGGWLGGWHRPKRLGVPDTTTPLAGLIDDGPPAHHPLYPDVQAVPVAASSMGHAQNGLAAQCLGEETPIYDPAAESKSDSSEVPWPKFHPVPTRPVFGAPNAALPMADCPLPTQP